jgi:hypothetical protein
MGIKKFGYPSYCSMITIAITNEVKREAVTVRGSSWRMSEKGS